MRDPDRLLFYTRHKEKGTGSGKKLFSLTFLPPYRNLVIFWRKLAAEGMQVFFLLLQLYLRISSVLLTCLLMQVLSLRDIISVLCMKIQGKNCAIIK